ncbi:hypothetical protein CMUS01_14933 [Colletotrichum musicola]|uniref:Uncharacterized protein n=1 Tax=Colletotrichum musicola TaxID=2175873 RepID=A0A8H6J051_9PEZI|nr:hypothetical protein CMUS01_14933 [Colletotrichum musicola]
MESPAGPGSRFGPPPKTHSIPRKPIQKRPTRTDFAPSWHRVAAERHERQITEDDEPRNDVRDGDGDAAADARTTPPQQRQSQQRMETSYDQPKSSPTVTVRSDPEKSRLTFDGKWRPSWLRPPVLAAFAGVFTVFTIALAFMLRYSRANNGLIGTQKNYVYAWRLGPTAILTLLAVLWARVELQAMRFMPWIATRRGQLLGRDGYSLDYTSMLSAKALVLSLQNKHYLVFLATTIGFFLKVQIIMAPGLYSLATLGNPAEIDLEIIDSFSVDHMAGNTKETTPYYNARVLQHSGMLYPFGVSDIAAYQTFNHTGVGRGNDTASLAAVVDGFFSDIQCIKLESHSVTGSSYHKESDGLRSTVDVNLKFQGCEAIFPVVNWNVSQPLQAENGSKDWTAFGNVNETLATERPCPNLPQQHPQFLYWLGHFKRSATNSSRMYLDQGAAVLCSPRSWLSKVQVVDDGVNPNVTTLPDEPKTPVAANVWKMLQASIPDYLGGGDLVSDSYQKHAWGPLRADQLFWDTRFGLELPDGGNSKALFDSDALYTSIRNLTESIGPFLGHHLVRQNDSSVAAGDEVVIADRLVVNEWVCVTMMTLFALVACLAFFVLVRYRRHTTIWHRSPATLLGNMIFLRDHPAFEESVTESSPEDPTLAWGRSNFNPVVLRPWARACFVLFAGALIGGLIYTLHRSQSLNGLSYVNEEGYWHLLWTSVPALVALIAYSYSKSCDWAFRHLATFYCLAAGPCGTKELDTSLLDMLGVRALFQSMRRRVWMVTFAQLLAIMCGVLMTLISILFTVEDVPEPTAVSLTQQTWFGAQPDKPRNTTDDYMINRLTVGSLLLRKDEDNFTYPRNTYNDLVFPILDGLENIEDPHDKSVRLTVPAAQAQASCDVFPEGRYTFEWSNHTEGEKTVARVTIVEPFTCNNSKQTKANFTTIYSPSSEAENTGMEDFGIILPSPENYRSTVEVCNLDAEPSFQEKEFFPSRTITYAIGGWDSRWVTEGSVKIFKCNYTFAKVDTEVNLINIDGEFVIDPKNPPKPDPSTSRSWDPPIELPRDWRLSNVSGVVDPYPDISVNQSGVGEWDREFRMFATSVRTLTTLDYGEEHVVDMLAQKYNFLQAQLLNLEGRVGVNEASKFNPGPGKQPPVEAAVTDHRRRLKQSPAVTYIIIVILGVAVVVNLLALLLGSRGNLFDMDARGLAPDLSNSIESRVSLLKGSNAAEHLPAGTELLSKEELHGQLSNVSFRMGWFRRADGARFYTVGVVGDDKFVFRGSRKDFETALEGGRRATYDTFASRVGTWKKSATFATKVRQNSF